MDKDTLIDAIAVGLRAYYGQSVIVRHAFENTPQFCLFAEIGDKTFRIEVKDEK